MTRHLISAGLGLTCLLSGPAANSAEPLLAPMVSPTIRQGLPRQPQAAICPDLQRAVVSAVGGSTAPWSISVLDDRGQLVADVNGTVARIPASNQKLISSAFALDRLGPDFRLRTQLLAMGTAALKSPAKGIPI